MALNRIYKVVWSKTKGCYVVVSELAKRVGRNKAKAIVISSAAMAMAVSPVMVNTVGAAINNAGAGDATSVAFGGSSSAGGQNSVAIGTESQATQNNAVAVGRKSKAIGDSATAIGLDAQASGSLSEAIGVAAKASGEKAVAISAGSNAQGDRSLAIGQNASTRNADTIALGTNATSTASYAVALGRGSQSNADSAIAVGNTAQSTADRAIAMGKESKATVADTIALGTSSEAKKSFDVVIGKSAQSRAEGSGHSIALGYGATAGSDKGVYSADGGGNAGGVAIGVGAFTGLNKTNKAMNSSVAVGAGAGTGYRMVGTDGMPTGNATDADDNDTVLVKAFGGTKSTLNNFKDSGTAKADGFFSFQGVDINEGTALGRNTRAMGDQSVAIGAQSIAGMGSIVIGGNDIQAYDGKKYFKAKNPTSGEAKGVNDFNAETTPGTGKNGQPITITAKYKELVGAELDRSYRASYGQDGSTVIGMQAHSTTPLGVAIGTNSIVRKGAFGATAIGSGASVVANAEAAVAIGMGAEAQGNYAVAAGTAARAKESAVAAGYTANAEVNAVAVGNKSVSKASAVAVGDESEATNSSVAVGQLAKAQKVADIAVGQGAVASGEQGAIAVGLGTQAQGDSSIMIGGSEITKVADQKVNYQKEKKDKQGHTVIKSTEKIETVGGEQVKRTIRSVEMETTPGTIQQAYGELTNGGVLNTATLDYSLPENKNGHGSISMGVHSLSTGDLGTAIGTGARVTKLGGVALGTGAVSELQNGVAIGTGSRADANSIGTRQTDISYDKEGKIVPFDSKKVAYTFYWAGGTNTSEGDVVSFGTPGAERQLKNVAAGRIADDSTDAINGSQLNSVTKRMSSGWAVEAEKDKTSSGVLKLNGTVATAGTEVHSTDGKTTTRENPGTATGHVDKVRLNDEVKIRVGDNLVLHQEDASRPVYEDPDNPGRQTGTRVTSKFTYSLNPELTGLKSAQFKNDAGDTTTINGAGVTVTPVTAGKQPVSLTTAGLNNGGNAISNVAGNLPETKNNDATTGASNATTSQAAPTLGNAANQVNPTNAATVSDVLNAGWNLQGDGAAVDFVKPYDTVNFVKGDGTSVTVESTDGKTSTVKYSVNLGEGLKKDDNNNITVKAADKSLTVGTDGVKVNPGDKSLKTTDAGLTVNTADKSLEVTDAGLKVKAGDKTLTTDANGLKVNTGEIESVTTGANPGTVKVKDGDTGKVATVDSVVNAVNSAAWTATSAATSAGELGATPADQSVKAGDKVTFEADKNIKITQAGSKFTFATRDDVSFNTVQVGGEQGPKLSKSDAGDLKVSGPNGTDPVKVTNVKDGEISADSKDAINGSQFHKLANNTIQLKGQTGDSAATETKKQELNKENGLAFTIKSSDGSLLEVSAADDTITLKPKTATLTTGADGVPTANTTGGNLVTADQLVNTLTSMGWKATAGRDDKGTVTDATVALIKAGDTVTFKAGNNLAVKQDGKNFIYSLQKELTGLTSAEFKNQAGDKTVINNDGVTITPVTNGKQPVSLTKDGLNNGGNQIANVGGNLDGAKTATTAPTTKHDGVDTTNPTAKNYVNPNNAATVGDVLQAGWNLQGNNTAVDFVKPYDTVNFVDGDGTTVSVSNTDTKTSTVKYSVNLGDGLKKDDNNNITVKAADKSLTVGADGVKVNPGDKSLKTTDAGLTVNTADKSLEVTNDGLKVKAGDNTLTTDEKGLKVNTGTIEPVTTGANPGTVKVKDGDAGKIATVDSVVNAVNSAAWTATSAATSAGELGATPADQSVKAGDKVTFEADKNIKITQAGSKFTFATRDDVSFNTVQVGGEQGPKLSKSDAGDLKVSGPNGTDPVKVTNVKDGEISADSKDAINGSQFHKLANNTIQLKGQTGDSAATETKKQELNKKDGIAFTVKSSDGTLLEVSAEGDTITLTPKTGTITTTDGVPTATTTNGKLITADQVVNALKEMGWKAIADKDGSGTVDGAAATLVKAGETVTFKAGNNLAVKQDGKNFIYSLQKELTGLTSAEFKNQAGDKTVINNDGVTITPATNGKQPVSLTKDGLNNGGNPITNVTSNLVNYTDPEVNGVQPAKNSLRNLDDNSVANTNAATVGDLRNMGWIVSSDKTTGANGTTTATAYSEAVKNANEVRFVGEGSAIVSGKTEGNVRTITVKVDNQTGVNKTVTPVNYTKADGTKVYPQEVDNGDGTKTVKFFENPDGTGKEIPSTEVITSVNGPKGTTTPATLSNVKSNLPDTKNSDTANTADAPSNATKSQAAPNTTDKAGNTYVNPNNAATVSDVLNAGWNLQGNGTEVDFVKAYDTVNFIDGEGTTATVASTDGKTSTVKYSVNLGKGLQKDDTGNTISVKPADSSLVVDDAGVKVNTGTINNVTTGDKPGTVEANNGDENKVATVGNVVNAINNAAWTATSAKTNDGELGKEATNQLVKSGDKVTFEADKNIKITQDGSKFTFTTKNDVSFDTVQVGGDQGPKLSKTDAGDLKVSGPNGTSPVKVTNVTSGLDKYGDQVNNADVPGTTDKNRGLVDLSKPENGQPKVSDNTAATVGDLRNMGWIVSADKKTGDLTNAYSDTVKNANEVKFVGAGTAIVSGKTEGDIRTITVKVDDQTSTNNAVTPVVYTDKDGNQVYPTGKKDPDGNQIFNTKPDGKGTDVTGPVKTTINGPKGTTSPTSLSNVKNNIPAVNDADKKVTNADGTDKPDAGNVANINKAPLTAEEAANLLKPTTKDGKPNPNFVGNNAATVSDVLNAGWNLQNNGTAKDFVKPYDTVNFVDGGNTTAVVTMNAAGTASDVTFNVTGLPVTNTITENGKEVPVVKVGNTFYPAKPDGTPDIQKGQDGNPTNGYVQADNGKVYPRDAVTITKNQDGTTTVTPNTDATPKTVNTNLVNPNVANTTDKPGNNVSTPNQLGNVANGAKTFEPVDGKVLANDGKWYPADKVSDKGTPEAGAKAVDNPLAPKNAAGEPLVQAKDGKWYKPSDLQPNGTPTPTAQPQDNVINNKAGLVDFSNSNPNNAATIGDLQNMGWVVSAQGNSYSDQVRNTNEVKFVGEGTASVTGKTDDKGVRTITVKVDDQVSTNNSVTPVVYTDKAGNTVYPIKDDKGNVTYHTTPDGKGENDKVVPNGDVNTSINGPKDDQGNTRPASLSNVKNNIPAVNDADKKVTNPDGTDKPDTGNVANINKAPLTAEEAADLLKPTTKDGKPNPNFVGNNAATVSDVLNAGWNLQNNGTAKDFVKPFDTVNFVNGVNTTAVVTTSEDGTTSNVTYNVTGLPVTYTTADGTPVSKIGDKYYKVNEQGQPLDSNGKPATKINENGVPVGEDGQPISEVNITDTPLTSKLVNPNATNTTAEPNKKTTDPTQLGNVTSGLDTYGDNVQGTTDKNRGLVDLSKPENGQPKVSDNTAATVGDLRNMGWIVSSDKTTGADGVATDTAYSEQVKNANEVKFVGAGTAIVSGNTVDGVRTITVKVDDQTSTNNAVTPVVYTDQDGNQVYPTGKKDKDGNQIFNKKPDGTGEDVTGPVKTTINGPKGTTSPTSLTNVKNNIPNVNDGSKTITDADGNEKPAPGDVENINKAPLTAEEAAALANPKTKDGQTNPKYIGNNAATVSDVLNAGWNLQNNGAARDFVKPFDTVNFVNGVNTTAVVTTSEDGTTSNVTYNVTGLPVTYTTADGTPVSKIGDDYYTVNDKGQPIDANGKPSTKVNKDGKPVDENGNVIKPIDTTANPLTSSLVNPNVKNTDAEPNKKTTDPTQLGNVTSGLHKYGDTVDGKEVPGSTKANHGLVDLSTPTDGSKPKVSDNTAATVGDLRNMGWIVSSDKTTGETDKAYTDTVKNANEVKFVGEGTAIVSGKTVDGVRTITVKVDDQVSTNNSVTPVNYTKADGTKVYPKMVTNPDTGKEELKFFEKPDGSGAEVPKGDVVTSINGPEGTTSPTTLKNVKNNIPNVNDGTEDITKPDGTVVGKTPDNGNINKAPLTAEEAAALANPKTKDGQTNPKYIGNNAATVSDVLNTGWNLQNNGESRDFVKPYDTVNFVNGLGTTAVVTTREGNIASDVTFNVKAANGSVTVDENGVKVTTGEMKPAVGTDNKETGAIATPADPAKAKQLKETLAAAEKDLSAAREALKDAEKALAANPKDPALQKAVADKKADVAAKQTPVNEAQKAHDEAGLNKVATVQNVAEAINNAGFNLKTSADGGEKLTGTKDDGELIKPSNTVEMVAGNNLTVKQDANGKITYATKDNVTFTNVDTGTLNVGSPNTYTDGKGNTYTKVGDKYYKPADVVNGAPKPDATPVDVSTTPVTPVSPVTMKAEAAKPATNNASDAQPSSALNVTSKDGKPTQITGVGSTLNTKSVDTTPKGTAPSTTPGTTPNTTPVNLVDLEGTAEAPVNKNAAATVGDLQNMGWVVSAKDGNGYKDVVKNANVVDFKGGKGIEITGKTLTDGTREITVGIKEGEVTNKVTITHADGSKTDAIKIGDNYYKVGKDGKPEGYEKGKDGKPAGTPLTVDPKNDKVTNTGAGFVTGNTVANAIQESGWNVGIGSTDKDYSKDAKVYDKVNPNDDVKFANGANTNVSMVTVDAINEDGTKKATTFVKVDVNRDLKIDSVTTGGTAVDKNGNNLVKVGDDYYKESDIDPVTKQPKANAKPVPKADVTPAKDGAMIVKNADGKDVVSATVGKDGNGEFAVKGKDGKDGISMTAKDGQGTIGVNGKDGATTTIKGDTITIKDKEGNTNTSTPTSNELKDTKGNTNTSTADKIELKDKAGNTNTSTPTTNVLKDTNGNTNTSTGAGTAYKDKDDNTAVVGPKEIALTDKSGDNKASFTNKDLIFNAKDPKTGVEKTSHVSGDKIAFTTTDEMEKVFDKDGKPVIDPATGKQKEVVKMEKVFDKDGKPVIDPTTGKQKEVIKNPGNSTEYTNEGLKVIPNSTVGRDANGNLTFKDEKGNPVMKDKDGNFVYMDKDGKPKPGENYTGAVGALKPNVVDNTRVISFGMDKPVLDKDGKPVTGPDGNPVMTEGISAGMQQMHNLAPGTKDTDAVNVSQLRGATININNRINRSGAQAAALAGLQSIQYDPLEPTQISAGVGYYQGASALALGVNHYKNESTMFHVGASFNGYGSEVMANASVTWKFGARADETAVKDTFRQGPISASYTLQDKVSALETQNKIQKDQLNELRATNAAQKAENEAQREELALMKAQIAELFKRMNG